ncbi:polypyrimidine tract-binding protein 1-like isoform X5 [Tubulanus polymorphus]|uniref:polypyrimidine tract-binding protein 1-like isoform X5 n=1 Tax=Tubulanus polymorphus TaxID=672921 RepID=UPI003DA69275
MDRNGYCDEFQKLRKPLMFYQELSSAGMKLYSLVCTSNFKPDKNIDTSSAAGHNNRKRRWKYEEDENYFTHDSNISNRFDYQRGSEELLSQTGMVANGTIMSPTQTNMADVNDAKKVKLDQSQAGPSKVLHVRNVPQDATVADIVMLGVPFGKVTNYVLLTKKAQALVEMEDVQKATAMRDYYTMHTPQLRGKNVHVQFSNHIELKTDSASPQVPLHPSAAGVNNMTQTVLQAANEVVSDENKKTVLRVIVEHLLYHVTIDVLYEIFRKFGAVQKIITFNKNNTFQALIQMANPLSARLAKDDLNGKNIYNGCCTLKIDFSKLNALNVKYNNEKSRDFTNNNLPAGDITLDQGVAAFGKLAMHPEGFISPQGMLASPFTMPGFGATPLTAYGAAAATAGEGGTGLMNGNRSGRSAPLIPGIPNGSSQLAGIPGFPHHAAALGAGLPMPGQQQTGPVLLVSNLNEQKITPDDLFTLFGVYGDVQRVKIIFNKKDNALVQFADALQAQTALTHTDKLKLWGKQIKVAPSKHPVVQMPKEGQPDAGLTKDFVNSPLHRFKKPNSKNHHNIFPPSATLHLSNIPLNVTEEQIKDAFQQTGGSVVAFKFFPVTKTDESSDSRKDRKMALIQMGSIEEATHALIAMHNYQLSDSSHLRVSFSKSTI